MKKTLSDLIDAIKLAASEGNIVYEILHLGQNWADALKEEAATSDRKAFMGMHVVVLPPDVVEPDSAFLVSEAKYGRVAKNLDFGFRRVRAAEALLRSGKVFVDPSANEAAWRYAAGLLFQDDETSEAMLCAILGGSSYSGSLTLRDVVTLQAHDGNVKVIAGNKPKELGDGDDWSVAEWLSIVYGTDIRCVSINQKIARLRAGIQMLTERERIMTQRRTK